MGQDQLCSSPRSPAPSSPDKSQPDSLLALSTTAFVGMVSPAQYFTVYESFCLQSRPQPAHRTHKTGLQGLKSAFYKQESPRTQARARAHSVQNQGLRLPGRDKGPEIWGGHSPPATSSPLPVFVNSVLLEHSQARAFTDRLRPPPCGCDRDPRSVRSLFSPLEKKAQPCIKN